MKTLPDGWPRISTAIYYEDPRAAIDWLCKVFGFELRLLVETGSGAVAHSELVFGDGLIMVAAAGSRAHYRSPKSAGGNTQSLMVYVDDAEAHCKRARELGAQISVEPMTSDYGEAYWSDRCYGAVDCEGHHWWFTQRMQTGDTNWSRVRNQVDKSHHG